MLVLDVLWRMGSIDNKKTKCKTTLIPNVSPYPKRESRSSGTETLNYSNQKIYYHRVKTNQLEDVLVVKFKCSISHAYNRTVDFQPLNLNNPFKIIIKLIFVRGRVLRGPWIRTFWMWEEAKPNVSTNSTGSCEDGMFLLPKNYLISAPPNHHSGALRKFPRRNHRDSRSKYKTSAKSRHHSSFSCFTQTQNRRKSQISN